MITSVNCWLAVAAVAPTTCNVKVAVPAAVGVPAITPDEFSVKPVGSAPAVRVHV